MNNFNIAWGLLHGGSIKSSDWIRGTSMKMGYNGREEAVKRILPEKDDSIRGWMTEAFLQAAIASSRGAEIKKLDPLNTYDNKLHGTHLALRCSSSQIFVERPSLKNSDYYEREVKYVITKDGTTYTITWTASDSSSGVKVLVSTDGSLNLPFFDGKVVLKGATTAATLPYFTVSMKFLPLVNPVEILEQRMGVPILNEPAGEFVLGLLRRNQ